MHEDATILNGKTRERTGSRYSRRIRANGGLPAIVYGHKQDPVAVTLDAHEALLNFHRGEKVFKLHLEGQADGEAEFVLLKELQYDHMGTGIVHADLERVDLDERVNVTVPLHFVGDAKGLKKSGTSMMHPHTELELECAVINLPDFIEVDVSDMDHDDTIKAGDITLPKPTMKLITDPAAEVATIVTIKRDALEDEAGTVDTAAEPEVISEKKEEPEED